MIGLWSILDRTPWTDIRRYFICLVYRPLLLVPRTFAPAALLTAIAIGCVFLAPKPASAAGPVDENGRPLIKKLGTIDFDIVETTPIVFQDKLYRFEWQRKNKYFRFIDCAAGRVLPPFAHGWRFGSAFVHDGTVYVTGAKESSEIRMFASKDLEQWQSYPILDVSGWQIFNTSICKAGDEFVLMFEVGGPREVSGVRFTARFAKSKDLRHWTLTPKDNNYAMDRYTAPHCLRWLDGWFYAFYLEYMRDGKETRFEMRVVRSKDLVHWDSSPLNPVLRHSPEDRKAAANTNFTEAQLHRLKTAVNINNSDIDFCEYKGRLIINYSWGSQGGVEHLAEAVYEGSPADFLRGWFPEKPSDNGDK